MGKLDGKRGTSRRVQDRIGKIFDGISAGKTEMQIAQEAGVTDRQIRYDMKKPEFQIRMNAMLTELSRKVPAWIDELHESENPLDRRAAAMLGMQLLKSKIPHQTENVSVNINVDQEAQVFGDIFDRLTPEQQAPIIEAYKNRKTPIMVEAEFKTIEPAPIDQ